MGSKTSQPSKICTETWPYCYDLEEAVSWADDARQAGRAESIGLVGNCADVFPNLLARDFRADVVTDQTSAHDPLGGYVPAGSPREAAALRREPEEYTTRSYEAMGHQVEAMVGFAAKGAVVFDYGNNLRAGAEAGGLAHDVAFSYPGFVPAFVRPLFCEGKGPFRWAALSGDPADIAETDAAVAELFPETNGCSGGCRWRERAGGVPGAAGADLLARLRRARPGGRTVQRARGDGRGRRADRDRRDHLDAGSVASPYRETEAMSTVPTRSPTGRSSTR